MSAPFLIFLIASYFNQDDTVPAFGHFYLRTLGNLYTVKINLNVAEKA